MNLVEELQSLDANDVGRWPLPFRVAVIAIVFLLVTGLGIYWFIVKDKAPMLERAEADLERAQVAFESGIDGENPEVARLQAELENWEARLDAGEKPGLADLSSLARKGKKIVSTLQANRVI